MQQNFGWRESLRNTPRWRMRDGFGFTGHDPGTRAKEKIEPPSCDVVFCEQCVIKLKSPDATSTPNSIISLSISYLKTSFSPYEPNPDFLDGGLFSIYLCYLIHYVT